MLPADPQGVVVQVARAVRADRRVSCAAGLAGLSTPHGIREAHLVIVWKRRVHGPGVDGWVVPRPLSWLPCAFRGAALCVPALSSSHRHPVRLDEDTLASAPSLPSSRPRLYSHISGPDGSTWDFGGDTAVYGRHSPARPLPAGQPLPESCSGRRRGEAMGGRA